MRTRAERLPQVLACLLAIVIAVLGWRWLRASAPRPHSAGGLLRATDGATTSERQTAELTFDRVGQGAARREAQDAKRAHGSAGEPAVLCGVIRSADGSLAKARVTLMQAGQRVANATSREGVFAIPGLAEGQFELRIDAATELSYRAKLVVRAPLTRRDILLPPRRRVTIRAQAPDTRPLRQALGLPADSLTAVAFDDVPTGAWPKDPRRLLGNVVGVLEPNRPRTPRDGATPMSDDSLGILALPETGTPFVAVVLGDIVLASRIAEAGETDMLFILDPAGVEGRLGRVVLTVIDATGQPIEGVRVRAGSQRAETDETGRAEVGSLTPGPTPLHLWARAEALPPIEVDVVGGGTIDLGRITALSRIQVPVDRGVDRERLVLRYYRIDGLPPGMRPALDVAVLQGGSNPLMLFPGRYRFLVEGSGGCCIRNVDLTHPPSEPLRFDLSAKGIITLESHVRVRAQIEILDRAGQLVWRQTVGTTQGGRFGLPVDTYTLVTTDSRGNIKRRQLELTETGAVVRVP